jgi:hypothetical protein
MVLSRNEIIGTLQCRTGDDFMNLTLILENSIGTLTMTTHCPSHTNGPMFKLCTWESVWCRALCPVGPKTPPEWHYVDYLQQLTLELYGKPLYSNHYSVLDWSANEVFGVGGGSYPSRIIEKLPQEVEMTKPEMIFMSKKLGVSVPFTPVHTPEEHELFGRCMSESITLEQTLDKFAVSANGNSIFPKLEVHLEKYMKQWKCFGENSVLLEQRNLRLQKLCKEMRSLPLTDDDCDSEDETFGDEGDDEVEGDESEIVTVMDIHIAVDQQEEQKSIPTTVADITGPMENHFLMDMDPGVERGLHQDSIPCPLGAG